MLLSLLAALVACAPKEEGEPLPPATGPVDDSGDKGDTSSCEGSVAPVIQEIHVENGGLYDFTDVIDCPETCIYPSVKVAMTVTDEDGDLHQHRIRYWYDEEVDGAVDTSGDLYLEVVNSRGEPCEVSNQPFDTLILVGEGVFEYNTLYEFAAEIEDAEGLVSELAIASGSTPKEDGSDGDGSGP